MSVLVVGEVSVLYKHLGLQLGTLLKITLIHKCLSHFFRLIIPNRETHQIHQIFGLFINLFFTYILYNCIEDVRGEYISAKYTMKKLYKPSENFQGLTVVFFRKTFI